MRSKISVVIFFFLLIFWFPVKAWAADEFATSYDVSYDVKQDATTEVTQKITLKNLTSQYYASNFTLTIGSTTVSEVTAFDETGPMEVQVTTKGNEQSFSMNKTDITVKTNQQVTGFNKSQTFTLKFKSSDFAQVIGKVWEVSLPKMPEGGNIEKYDVTLSVPISFGDPTSISPSPRSESQTLERLLFHFDKEQLNISGVSVNFGTVQVFNFILKYQLENKAFFPVLTSIILPPDTIYQDISINQLNPEPTNVTIDEDGNFLAWYRLPRQSRKEIRAVGSAKIYLNPKLEKFLTLSDFQRKELTKADRFWEKDNPMISNVLATIFKDGAQKKTREKARLIYRYVVTSLKYSTEKVNSQGIERLGAVTVLNNPDSAVCMEFTDLFIALARSAGIPARELDGFAYTTNPRLRPLSLSKDLLHSWPEYFDEDRGWVMIDPTWENTSGGVDYFNRFDLNHLVLAIKGQSSVKPSPPEDVKVTVSESDFVGKSQIIVELEAPRALWAGFPATATVKISNQGTSLQPASVLSINSSHLTVLGQQQVKIVPLPPFGKATYRFNLRTANILDSWEDSLDVQLAGQKFTQKVIVKPFFLLNSFPYTLAGLGVTLLGIYGIILGIHIYQKKTK